MKQRCLIVLLLSGFVSLGASAPEITPTREQVTVENWDKGAALSHWVYTHISDVFPTATIHRTGSDAYRDPAHKQFQLEATLGWQPRGAPQIPDVAKRGDLFGLLGACKRVSPPGEKWAYTSSNTAVLGEVISRVTDKSLADNIS